MKIKILSATINTYWYSDKIGKEYNVNNDGDKYLLSDISKGKYWVDKKDCEVIK